MGTGSGGSLLTHLVLAQLTSILSQLPKESTKVFGFPFYSKRAAAKSQVAIS